MHDQNGTSLGRVILDAKAIVQRLEEAGRTLMALPNTGPSTRLVQSGLEWVRDVSETYGRERGVLKPAIPDAAQISRMDQALAWIPLIPIDKYVVRRVVGARSLVSPMTDRHLFSWRRLATAMGADHKAVQRWHAHGIDLIQAILAAPPRSSPHRNSALPQAPRHHGSPHA